MIDIGMVSGIMTIFSIQNPLIPYIMDKVKEEKNDETKIFDLTEENIDEYLRYCLMNEFPKLIDGNISSIISNKEEIAEKIVQN